MQQKANLLIVDDEANTLASLSRAFRLAGHEATVCDNAAKALELAHSQHFDLILSDVVMPGKDGLSLLEDLKSQGITTPVVMMSGQAHIEMAVHATRLGALDFLEKPISTEKLLLTVENALKLQRLESENRQLRQRLGKHEIIWTGKTMQKLMAQVERAAASETRHEKRSSTGAASRHLGKFEQAEHGTIFLDEIGDMPLAMQAKLLRVLEEGEVERIGGDKLIPVDVRVLVATHRSLETLVREGKFRQDLFHRVYVFPLMLPRLRERQEDIPALVEHFAQQVCAQNNWKPIPFAPEAIQALEAHRWPGNVRELRNVVERLMLLATDGLVSPDTVQFALPQASELHPSAAGSGPLAERVQGFEREMILAELKRSNYHITNAAKTLGLERSHFYKKAEQLGIDLRALRQEPGGTTGSE